MNDNYYILLGTWTLWALVVYGGLARRIWVDVSYLNRGAIRFYITDFWAAALGLVPSFALIAYFIRMGSEAHSLHWIIASTTVVAQIGGMVWFRHGSEGRADDRFVPRFSQAMLVLAGAAIGLLANVVCLIVTAVGAIITIGAIAAPMVGLVIFVIYIYARILTGWSK